ncbi:MAG: nuclear transport factor 2 family protein [Woeseiaceae bacterium]
MKRVRILTKVLLLSSILAGGAALAQDDVAELTAMLEHFLANADDPAVHERFWSEDLVYSSSAGLRFGKADIMEGFAGADPADDTPPPIAYRGEEIDVRLYDDVAVVAFKLVGTPVDGSGNRLYFNTGTFLKRDGEWRAVAWQATRIPSSTDD